MKNYIFLVWFPIPLPRFTSILPCLIRLYTFCYNVVNMYWTRLLPFTLSFVKRHLALDDSRMVVQTRWCYMDVETRNICFCDYDQKMWFTCYTECIPFGFYVVPRQQPSICEWLWGVKKVSQAWHTPCFSIEVQIANDTMTHRFLLHLLYILGIMLYSPTKNVHQHVLGSVPQFTPALHFIISKSSL